MPQIFTFIVYYVSRFKGDTIMQHYPEKKKKTTPNHLPRYILVGMVMFIAGFIAGGAFLSFFFPYRIIDSMPYPSATPIEYVEIVIAIQSIPCGYTIPESAVALVPYPLSAAPLNSVTDLEAVVGRVARTDLIREMPILYTVLVDKPEQVVRGCELPKP
jgi:Flp pilus assembly protein CpaB